MCSLPVELFFWELGGSLFSKGSFIFFALLALVWGTGHEEVGMILYQIRKQLWFNIL